MVINLLFELLKKVYLKTVIAKTANSASKAIKQRFYFFFIDTQVRIFESIGKHRNEPKSKKRMNILQKLARQIIKKSFNFSVWTIQQFHDEKYYANKVENLRKYPIGTLGNDVIKCLDDNNLGLVPKYESHDLKHVLLDYKMTPVDEIRMQAFMLGNGNYTIPCFVILTFGALLLPDEWSTFYKDFKSGQKSKPISSWTIEKYANFQTQALRKQIIEAKINEQRILNMKKITKYCALTSIISGIFGMLFCLPFLFSSNIADLVGAGFPFVGGAILTIGGLFTFSNLTRQTTKYA